MEENKVHFRHLMHSFYKKGKNATQTANEICAVYGEGAVAERTVISTLHIKNAGGTPSPRDEDQIKTLIENNPHYTTRNVKYIKIYRPRTFCEAWLRKSFRCMGSLRFPGEKSD